MAGTTDFLPFATGGGANVISQSLYAADTTVTNGFSSGIAPSAKFNKVWRQSSFVAAGVATWMANTLNTNIPDDGNLSSFVTNLGLAVKAAATAGAFVADTGSVNALAATTSSPPTALVAGLSVTVQAAYANTGNVTFNFAGLGAVAVKNEGQQIKPGQIVAGGLYLLEYDGTQWQLLTPGVDVAASTTVAGSVLLAQITDVAAGTDTAKAVTSQGVAQTIQSNSYLYAADSGSANALVVTLVPALTAYTTGMAVTVKVNANNTGATTININGLGAKTVQFNGAALTSGQLVANNFYTFRYDGTNFQLETRPSTAAVIVASSLGANGYVKWSNGLIEQWVNVSCTAGSGTGFSWPIAFPTALFSAVPGGKQGLTSSGSYSAYIDGPTTTGGTAYGNNGASASSTVSIHAKGN